MKKKILNIHGYHGSANNTAYKVLEELYPNQVVSPQIDYDTHTPNNVLSILERLVEDEEVNAIVGTSFGGFFACCVGCNREIPVILINPCLLPFITLQQLTESYPFDSHSEQQIELFGKSMGKIDRRYFSTIIGKSDEIINHNDTTQYLVKSKRWYEINGGHHLMDTDELTSSLREIFSYYEENLDGIQESETIRFI